MRDFLDDCFKDGPPVLVHQDIIITMIVKKLLIYSQEQLQLLTPQKLMAVYSRNDCEQQDVTWLTWFLGTQGRQEFAEMAGHIT